MALEYIYIYSDFIFSVALLIAVSCVLLCLLSLACVCVCVLSVTGNALFHIQLSADRHWIWETYVCNVIIWKERSTGFNHLNVFMNTSPPPPHRHKFLTFHTFSKDISI